MLTKGAHMKHAIAACAAALSVALPALAQNSSEHDAHHPAQAQGAMEEALADGEVRKVDKEAGKITLKHGPITNLGMPPMTMVFRAKDQSLLADVNTGDKVKFRVEQIGGQYTVTRMERQP